MAIRISDVEHVLVFTNHHIVDDGWSQAVLARELSELYAAFETQQPSPLAELPIQYADFARWQQAVLKGPALDSLTKYWAKQLAGSHTFRFPADRARNARRTHAGSALVFEIAGETTEKARALSRASGATLFMTFLAAFYVLLHRYTGEEDITIGTDVANRNRFETESLIGFFVNILVLRLQMSDDPTFADLLTRVRKVCLDAYQHQDLPFDKLVQILRSEGKIFDAPLFAVLFVFQNAPQGQLTFSGMQVREEETPPGPARFDLAVFLREAGQNLWITWQYSTDVFDAGTVQALAEQYLALVDELAQHPDAPISASTMDAHTDHALLVDFNESWH
jgi:hypothetical protein